MTKPQNKTENKTKNKPTPQLQKSGKHFPDNESPKKQKNTETSFKQVFVNQSTHIPSIPGRVLTGSTQFWRLRNWENETMVSKVDAWDLQLVTSIPLGTCVWF